MKFINHTLAAIALALVFAACKDKRDVFVVGSGPGATLWKNGVASSIDNCNHPNFVFAAGDDIYVAGLMTINHGEFVETIPAVWKNGAAMHRISLRDEQAEVNSYFLAGDDVYAVGIENDNAMLWKNGKSTRLPPEDSIGDGTVARAVFVSGSDVYVAGGQRFAMLWKNNVAARLGEGKAFAVFVSGYDVYVAGSQNGSATLWKNGAATRFGDGTAYSVYVAGNDVYVAGAIETSGKNVAMLWKNGIATRLSDPANDARPKSVFVSGKDVFVAGSETVSGKTIATLWKNGKPTRLSNLDGSEANAVFVK